MSASSPADCLAPDIVEAVLDERPPAVLRLAEMLRGMGRGTLEWVAQALAEATCSLTVLKRPGHMKRSGKPPSLG